jgi:hypothetical protein
VRVWAYGFARRVALGEAFFDAEDLSVPVFIHQRGRRATERVDSSPLTVLPAEHLGDRHWVVSFMIDLASVQNTVAVQLGRPHYQITSPQPNRLPSREAYLNFTAFVEAQRPSSS